MKILFIHNTLPEYRIPWFIKMNDLCEIKYIFTNEDLNKKIYSNDIDYKKIEQLEYEFLTSGLNGFKQMIGIIKSLNEYDYVELPPVDSLKEFLVSVMIVMKCKMSKVRCAYFWEKWEAPKDYQPFKRKIKNYILGLCAKIIYLQCDTIFASGSRSKEYFLSNNAIKEKVFTIPDHSESPICNIECLKKIYNIDENKIIILYFGRIMEEKGLDILISALAILHNKQNVHLIVAGDGLYKLQCVELSKHLNLENITFTGYIHPNNRKNYFSQCDIFVLPGTFRNGWVDVWGLTLNEALKENKFIISTDAVGSAFDIIKNGKNGYRVKAGSVENLANAIDKVIERGDNRQKESTNQSLNEFFSYENMAATYINTLLEDLEVNK